MAVYKLGPSPVGTLDVAVAGSRMEENQISVVEATQSVEFQNGSLSSWSRVSWLLPPQPPVAVEMREAGIIFPLSSAVAPGTKTKSRKSEGR